MAASGMSNKAKYGCLLFVSIENRVKSNERKRPYGLEYIFNTAYWSQVLVDDNDESFEVQNKPLRILGCRPQIVKGLTDSLVLVDDNDESFEVQNKPLRILGCRPQIVKDMDDTLYPMSSGLNLACRKNIEDYMLHHLQIEESEVPKMCLDLYREHGTTMAGLKALGYHFDNDEFHAYVHGRLPYDSLKPDPVLRNLLLSMPPRKIIFTNADKAHAAKVLSRLGLEDCFEGIICFETLNPLPKSESDDDNYFSGNGWETENKLRPAPILCKPNVEAIEAAIQIANIDPDKTVFFDDSARNIAAGKAAGLHTVIVGTSMLVPGADYALNSIHNIKEALPEIWDAEEGEQMAAVIQNAVIETVVLA